MNRSYINISILYSWIIQFHSGKNLEEQLPLTRLLKYLEEKMIKLVA